MKTIAICLVALFASILGNISHQFSTLVEILIRFSICILNPAVPLVEGDEFENGPFGESGGKSEVDEASGQDIGDKIMGRSEMTI